MVTLVLHPTRFILCYDLFYSVCAKFKLSRAELLCYYFVLAETETNRAPPWGLYPHVPRLTFTYYSLHLSFKPSPT